MSPRHRLRPLHTLAWYAGLVALVVQLLAPAVQTATKVQLARAMVVCQGQPGSMHMGSMGDMGGMHPADPGSGSPTGPLRVGPAAHDTAIARLCRLTCDLAHATANALPAGVTVAPLLRLVVVLPRTRGAPLAAHPVEALHPQATGPPA